MCSTKPKFITLLYFIFIIAYKLLVRSCIDLEWLWLSLIQWYRTCLWNNHLNCCSIVPFLDSIRLKSSRCWYWANFPSNFHRLPEEAYPRIIIMYNLATHNQSHPKRQNFAIFRLRLIPCSSHLMSFGLKPTTTKYLQVAKSFPKLF